MKNWKLEEGDVIIRDEDGGFIAEFADPDDAALMMVAIKAYTECLKAD